MNAEIINFLGGSAILISAIAWLVRSLVVHHLNKDVDIFKNNLQHTSKVEAHKLSLLHEKRAEVVAELYQLLIEFVSAAHSFASPIEYAGEASKDEKGILYQQHAAKFRNYYIKNKIYFSRSICNAVDDIWNVTSDPIMDFGY